MDLKTDVGQHAWGAENAILVQEWDQPPTENIVFCKRSSRGLSAHVSGGWAGLGLPGVGLRLRAAWGWPGLAWGWPWAQCPGPFLGTSQSHFFPRKLGLPNRLPNDSL